MKKNAFRSAVAALVAIVAAPTLAWNDGPPADDDTLPRATWTVDAPTNRSPQGDDTARHLAGAPPPEANGGVTVSMIAMPLGDGGPGDELRPVLAAPAPVTSAAGATATVKVERPAAKPCGC